MSDTEKLQFILRVLRLIDPFELDEILWRVNGDDVKFFVQCSDLFWWATVDGEELTPENIGELERAYADVRAAAPDNHRGDDDAKSLFCCRIRQMRPQGCCYPTERKLWPLFDACGPERETGLGNPYAPGEREERMLTG